MKIKQVLVGAGLLLTVGACGKTSITVNPPAGFKCPEGTSVTYREGDYEKYKPLSNPACAELDRYGRAKCGVQSTDKGHYSQWLCIPNPKDVGDSSFIAGGPTINPSSEIAEGLNSYGYCVLDGPGPDEYYCLQSGSPEETTTRVRVPKRR